eukprot:733722-Pleurochrysis_carterae.AAC.2
MQLSDVVKVLYVSLCCNAERIEYYTRSVCEAVRIEAEYSCIQHSRSSTNNKEQRDTNRLMKAISSAIT